MYGRLEGAIVLVNYVPKLGDSFPIVIGVWRDSRKSPPDPMLGTVLAG